MNLLIIPFHDWRKSQREGFRTRDAHFIKALSKIDIVDKIIILNRPTTHLELLYNNQKTIIQGEVMLKRGRFSLYKVDSNTFVIDFLSHDIFSQVLKKHLWFIDKYACDKYIKFIEESYKLLGIEKISLLSQNIFAYKLAVKTTAINKVFDAWDNFLKFPAYKKITKHLEIGYQRLSNERFFWITNSEENIFFFKTKFKVKNIQLIKNGVEVDFIKKIETEIPSDLRDIKKPIIGFGGKISYLLNVDLINYLTLNNPNKSFVFVGQILNKQIYRSIIKRQNVFFLGDKHYDEYYKYVINFDICIVPYNINEGQHGGDSIKAYEYLSTKKKVVGTKGNGLLDLSEYLYLTNCHEEFSKELKETKNEKSILDVKSFSWRSKAEEILNILSK